MERRELIRWLVATAGLHYLDALAPADLLALGRDVHRAARRRDSRVLPGRLQRTVSAAAERIIPATETPGATDAGVPAFIEKIVADWYTPTERERLLAGLAELDTRARARFGREFIDCEAAEQVTLLTAFDEAAAANREHWFAMLKFLTVYGYCTSESGARALGLYPLPTHYDGCATV